MTRLKNATFESNAITGTDAFTASSGSPTVDGTSKIKGTYSARTNWATSANVNGTISGLSETEMWVSFYLRPEAFPPTGSSRVVTFSNGSTQFNLTLTSAGALNARMNSTTIQNGFATLSLNTNYRIGIRVKCSTALANADAEIDVYVVTGDVAFPGTPTLANAASTMNVSNGAFTQVVFGQNNGGATSGDLYWDNIRIDNVSMPTDDVAVTGVALSASGTVAITGSASMSIASSVALSASGTIAVTGSAAISIAGLVPLSASGTLAITGSAAMGVSGGPAVLGASGTIAITGSASMTLLSTGAWNWTRFKRPLVDRYLNITIAATAGTGYLGVSKDGTTYSWFSGPLLADGRTLTAVADETAAKAAAIALPASGVWSLPTTTEARIFKLGHKGAGPVYTVREFYPRRLVEADDIRAESIRAIHIAAGSITGDRIFATAIDGFVITGSTIQTAATGARVVLSSAAFGGIIGYNGSDTYNPATGGGTYQILWNKGDGRFYAGTGKLVIDSTGISTVSSASSEWITGGYKLINAVGGINYGVINGTHGAFGALMMVGVWNASTITYAARIQFSYDSSGSGLPTSNYRVNIIADGSTILVRSGNIDLSASNVNVSTNLFIGPQASRYFHDDGTYTRFNGNFVVDGDLYFNANWASNWMNQLLKTTDSVTFNGIATSNGNNSMGNIAVDYLPTSANWASGGTTLYVQGNDFSSIGFHDAGSRVDFIVGGGGIIRLGYNGGWGPAVITIPGNLRVSASGVYIGNTGIAPTKLIELASDSAGKPTTNTWQIVSDARTKRNVRPYEGGWDLVKHVNPVHFEYNGLAGMPEGDGGVGVIAQEVQEFAPQMVYTVARKMRPDDEMDTDILEYQGNELQYALVNALKEAMARIEELEKKITKGKK